MRALLTSSAFAALVLAAPFTASAQTLSGPGQFCLKKAESQATNCLYQTMAQCEASKTSSSQDQCIPRSAAETTGAGPMAPGANGKSDPAAADRAADVPKDQQQTSPPNKPQ